MEIYNGGFMIPVVREDCQIVAIFEGSEWQEEMIPFFNTVRDLMLAGF